MIAKRVKVARMNQPASDYAYWRSRPIRERIDALETLRQQYMGCANNIWNSAKMFTLDFKEFSELLNKIHIKTSATPRETKPITGAHIL